MANRIVATSQPTISPKRTSPLRVWANYCACWYRTGVRTFCRLSGIPWRSCLSFRAASKTNSNSSGLAVASRISSLESASARSTRRTNSSAPADPDSRARAACRGVGVLRAISTACNRSREVLQQMATVKRWARLIYFAVKLRLVSSARWVMDYEDAPVLPCEVDVTSPERQGGTALAKGAEWLPLAAAERAELLPLSRALSPSARPSGWTDLAPTPSPGSTPALAESRQSVGATV